MKRRVLVTGANGFIGYPTLLAVLAEGWHAVGFDLAAPAEPIGSADFVRGDFTDAHQVYRTLREHAIDTIVHTGGVSGPMLFRDNPYYICNTNVVGTMHLLEAARATGVARFVFLSSAQAYGDTPAPPVSEDAPLHTRDLYGATKAAGDVLVRAYREQYKLDAVALRISYGYGPRRRTRNAILTMLQDALDGRETALDFGGGYGRQLLYVRDAVTAIIAAIKAPSFSQHAYNISGSDFVTMEDIAGVVRKVLPNARITMKPGVDTLGYRRERLDISAAEKDLGWVPQWEAPRGIADYAQWLRDERSADTAIGAVAPD
jgi:UDP-glucuronate 4-epimerase